MIRTAALALLTFALTACGGEGDESRDVDEATWKSDLAAELGHENFDFGTLKDLTTDDCKKTSTDDWVLGLTLTGAEAQADVTRINLRHACPDILVTYEGAWAEVRDLAIDTEELCSTPLDQLEEEDRLKAQAVC